MEQVETNNANKLGEKRSGAVVFLKKDAVILARIKDDTPQSQGGTRKEYVRIQLLEDLYLNYEKRLHAFLEASRCYIPELNEFATSVNHAYTIISTHYEIKRRAKGGNVFNKVYYETPQGCKSLGTLRTSILKGVKIDEKSAAAATIEPDFGLIQITDALNYLLNDEALFVTLVHQLIERCYEAHGLESSTPRRPASDLSPFYQYVFGQFRSSLLYMNLDELIYRWSCNLTLFLRGAWRGYFLNEVESMVTDSNGFTRMIVDAARPNSTTEHFKKLDDWIKVRT